jgi:hypothetical protein
MSDFKPMSFFLDHCLSQGVKSVELGIYKYVPQSVDDERTVRRAGVENFIAKFGAIREKLGNEFDISIHSRVFRRVAGKVVVSHIPMLDLAGELPAAGITALQEVAGEFDIREFAIFHSGRSYHVYFYKCLSASNWLKFMGRCLLLNAVGQDPLVDSRWIGHRIYAGYAALRWTRRNHWYVGDPFLSVGFDIASQRTVGSGSKRPRVGTVQPWLFPVTSA